MPTNLVIRIKAIQKYLHVETTGLIDIATCTELEKVLQISNVSIIILERKKQIQKN